MTKGSTGKGFSIPYNAITLDSHEFVSSNRITLFCAAIFWAAANAILILATRDMPVDGDALAPWIPIPGSLIIAIVSWIIWHRGRVAGTSFQTPNGPMEILADKNHDAILREIDERRRTMVRATIAKFDPSNEPAKEAQKFRWLKANHFISEQEFDFAIAEIGSPVKAPFPIQEDPPKPLS